MSLCITLDDFERNSSGQYIFKPGASSSRGCPVCSQRASECPHTVEDMRGFLLAQAQPVIPLPSDAQRTAQAMGNTLGLARASDDWFARYLANDKQARKQAPLARGLFGYFPNACLHVAHVSFVANEQHNPGLHMQWAFNKSSDEPDCELRHMLDAQAGEGGGFDDDGLLHLAKKAWRAMADLERFVLSNYHTARPGVSVTGFNADGMGL